MIGVTRPNTTLKEESEIFLKMTFDDGKGMSEEAKKAIKKTFMAGAIFVTAKMASLTEADEAAQKFSEMLTEVTEYLVNQEFDK